MEESIFDCSICVDKLDDAMETKCCHHCFCRRCIEEWMQRNKSCPSCRKALTTFDLVPNVPIQRIINNLPAECPNFKLGCTSKLTRGILKEHLLNSCEFVEVLCANHCGIKVLKRDQLSHQRESCSRRLMPCIQCSLAIPLDVILEHMNTQCMKGQVLCLHCKALPLRENLHRHHQYECLNITLTCPFAQFGCQFKGLRPEYNKHMIEDSDLHIGVVTERESRMSEEIARLKNELERVKGNRQSGNQFSFEEHPFGNPREARPHPFNFATLNQAQQNMFDFGSSPNHGFAFSNPPVNKAPIFSFDFEPKDVVLDSTHSTDGLIVARDDTTQEEWKAQLKDARRLTIKYAKVSSVSLNALLNAVKHLPTMREINIDRCTLSEECIMVLKIMLPELKHVPDLSPIWLKYCSVPKSCQIVIREMERSTDYHSIILSANYI